MYVITYNYRNKCGDDFIIVNFIYHRNNNDK